MDRLRCARLAILCAPPIAAALVVLCTWVQPPLHRTAPVQQAVAEEPAANLQQLSDPHRYPPRLLIMPKDEVPVALYFGPLPLPPAGDVAESSDMVQSELEEAVAPILLTPAPDANAAASLPAPDHSLVEFQPEEAKDVENPEPAIQWIPAVETNRELDPQKQPQIEMADPPVQRLPPILTEPANLPLLPEAELPTDVEQETPLERLPEISPQFELSPSQNQPLPEVPEQPRAQPQAESEELIRLPAVTPRPRPASSELTALSHRAVQRTQQAFLLAQRGAYYSARSELIQVLRQIARALDAEDPTAVHSRALSAGLRALKEADDFAAYHGGQGDVQQSLADLVSVHRSPVLKESSLERLTPLMALEQYYGFAQEQLAKAGDHLPAASLALYGMAKVQMTIAGQSTKAASHGGPKAMALHQAALRIDSQNYLAANELGVLLARYGQYEEARRVLLHSLQVMPQPETWHNLAVVHENLGQFDLAGRARYEQQLALQNQQRGQKADQSGGGLVRWVNPRTLANQSRVGNGLGTPHR